ALVGEEEPPILEDTGRPELDRFGVLEPEPANWRDRDPGDAGHARMLANWVAHGRSTTLASSARATRSEPRERGPGEPLVATLDEVAERITRLAEELRVGQPMQRPGGEEPLDVA